MSPDQRAEEVGQLVLNRKAAQKKLDGLLGAAREWERNRAVRNLASARTADHKI